MALYESIKGKVLNEAKKKPSAGLTKKEKSAVVKKAKAGKDIGKKGKGFSAVKKKVTEGAFSSIKKGLSLDKQYQSAQAVINAIGGLAKEFKHLKFSPGDQCGWKVSNGPMSYIYCCANFDPTKQVATISVFDYSYRKISTIESDSDSILSKVKKDIQSRFYFGK